MPMFASVSYSSQGSIYTGILLHVDPCIRAAGTGTASLVERVSFTPCETAAAPRKAEAREVKGRHQGWRLPPPT